MAVPEAGGSIHLFGSTKWEACGGMGGGGLGPSTAQPPSQVQGGSGLLWPSVSSSVGRTD